MCFVVLLEAGGIYDFEACLTLCTGYRIHKDLVDPEKLQATLTDEALNEACDLNRALEMVALLEAQLKEMNPNLDSISEYDFLCCSFKNVYWLELNSSAPLAKFA